MAIANRYEFMYYLSCVNANPNGDPDMDNAPRVDPDTMTGLITDAATKRRIRDYVELAYEGIPGMEIFVQANTNLNRKIAEAKESTGVEITDKSPAAVSKASVQACKQFWDVRTFGAVMSSGPNAGQVRGPVQIAFGTSLDPIQQADIGITRVACAMDVKNAKTADDYRMHEAGQNQDSLRTMGRKQFTPYGLYEIHGFISPKIAETTGFDDADLMILFKAMTRMYDVTRTASKGTMSMVSPLIIFRHVGDPSRPKEEQKNQAMLGRAPAYKLFELVHVEKKSEIGVPRSHKDYNASIRLSQCPDGVDVGFLMSFADEVSWNHSPANNDWLFVLQD